MWYFCLLALIVNNCFGIISVLSVPINQLVNVTDNISVRKCCQYDELLTIDGGSKCTKTNVTDTPELFARKIYSNLFLNETFEVAWIKPNGNICPTDYLYSMPEVDDGLAYHLVNDTLEISDNFGILDVFTTQFFCLDTIDRNYNVGLVHCFQSDNIERMVKKSSNTWGMLISMPFLAITFIVYALLPDKNLYQNALMIYVLTLFLAYLLLVLINYVTMMENAACVIIGYLTLFSFTTSFFWLNVICFDIWFTFSRGRSIVGGRRNSELKKLGFYSIYAFGVPLLLIILIYLLQTKILDPSSIHNPKIGVGKCFLETGWPSLWYLYLEAGLIIIANLVFFSWTAISIRKVKKETAMLKHNDSKRHAYEKNQKKFNLFIKLAFAMGINWSTEIISWFVNWQTDSAYSKIWIVTDCVNALYGVFIFFIFVFKKKTWRLLKRRYYAFRGKVYLAHSMGGTSRPTNVSTTESTVTTTVNGPRRPEDNILLHDRR